MKDTVKKGIQKIFKENPDELKQIILFLDNEILNCIDKLKSKEATQTIEDVRDSQSLIQAYETTKWLFK